LLADVDEINLQSTLEDITARGGEADFILTNVADPDDAQQMVSEAVNRFGDLHILVNNAGINRDAIMHKMTDEQWDQVIAVNLSGVFYCSRAANQYILRRVAGKYRAGKLRRRESRRYRLDQDHRQRECPETDHL
jgi:3-oxoacyl-[acyl-carrier protein] reductase/2-hydroxycyclohexanecarboxyl-CoA dehydrogenase